MQGDNGGKQLHGDRQGAKCPLQAHPEQGERGPPGRQQPRGRRQAGTLAGMPVQPTGDRHGHNQRTDPGGEVAVQHLDPGLGLRHGTSGHGRLLRGNGMLGAQWRGTAVTTRPIRTTQARVSEPGERAKQDQIESQEQREQTQCLGALQGLMVAIAPVNPDQRTQGQQRAQQQQTGQGCQVVEGLRVHGVIRLPRQPGAQVNPTPGRPAANAPCHVWLCWQQYCQAAKESASWCCPSGPPRK